MRTKYLEVVMAGQGSTGNVIAALCSVVVPGLGQLIQGRVLSAIFYFLVVGGFYGTVIFYFIGIIFHLFCVISAATFRG